MGKKILLVDDEPDALEIYAMRLEVAGYQIIKAEDGEKALALAKTEKPDLIILDLMLPKIEGFDVCRSLKFDDEYKNIPIVILSALIQASDKQKATDAGANDFFSKPVDFNVFLKRLKELMG
jgi:two-component system alkaline phosphatase synthesis response regulator PhoP